MRWDNEELTTLRALHAQGASRRGIADVLGRSEGSVKYKLSELGLIKLRQKTGPKPKPKPKPELTHGQIWDRACVQCSKRTRRSYSYWGSDA